MGRYLGPSCRLCRREGTRLFLKGEKCYSAKCPMNKRAFPPGMVSKFRRKPTEYAIQLREKQKVKRHYGLMEKQFRKYYEMASRHKGVTGELLLKILESRLDNIVYRAGFAPSRKAARQLVKHGHILVNGKKVDIPSYLLREGDVVSVKESAKNMDLVVKAVEAAENKQMPTWISVDLSKLEVKIEKTPEREDLRLEIDINEQLIVELYSK